MNRTSDAISRSLHGSADHSVASLSRVVSVTRRKSRALAHGARSHPMQLRLAHSGERDAVERREIESSAPSVACDWRWDRVTRGETHQQRKEQDDA